MNNAVFGKTMENIRKHRDIKLVATDKKRNKLVLEPNYHTINYISEDLSIIEMNKTKIKMNKPTYLGLSILEISKILMYKFWYDYMKPKYNDNVKLLIDEVVLNSQQRFISKKHDVYTENINKIALSNNDDKRIVSSDKITSYPYRCKGKKCIN